MNTYCVWMNDDVIIDMLTADSYKEAEKKVRAFLKTMAKYGCHITIYQVHIVEQ